MNESGTETTETIEPRQIAFDLPETPNENDPPVTPPKAVVAEEKKPQEKKEEYRPYCGEGHGKMLPSKFGGFWCPKCRGR